MKTNSTLSPQTNVLPGWMLNKSAVSRSRFTESPGPESIQHSNKFQLYQPGIELLMAQGILPDLHAVCQALTDTFSIHNFPFKATQFLSVLSKVQLTDTSIQQLIKNINHKHVLIENDLLKVVLIVWPKGEFTSVHGHPSGGCAFKLLHGKLIENRYEPGENGQLLSTSYLSRHAISYLDDNMAFHQVINNSPSPAISLHVYTPGIKK